MWLYEQLIARFPHSVYAQRAIAELSPKRVVRVGNIIPLIELPTFGQKTIDLAKTVSAAKYTLIEFWGTWCAPCIAEMKYLHEANDLYGAHNQFKIISIALGDSQERIAEFRARRWPMPWDHAAISGWKDPIAVAFQVVSVPQSILVDSSGRIVAYDSDLRGAELLKTLSRLID